MEQFELLYIPVLLIGGFVASVINVVAGGGSYLTLSILILAGLPPGVANGTNRIGILAGNLSSAAKFVRLGQIKRSDLWYFCLPAMLGGIAGAYLATQTADRTLRVVLAVLMLFGSWTVIKKPDQSREKKVWAKNWSFPLFSGVGLYAGFIQAGTGFFSLAASTLLGHDLKRGNAVKTVMNLSVTVPALAIFWGQSMVAWPAGLALAVGMGLGGLMGVKVSQESNPENLRKMVAAAILLSAVFVVYPLLNGPS